MASLNVEPCCLIIFGGISLTRVIFRKYLKEISTSEFYLYLYIRYFAKLSNSTAFFRSITDPNDTGQVYLQA